MSQKILFICLGNICRSPTAEAVFRDRVEAAGLSDAFEIDSAGILSVHKGSPADTRMRRHAKKRGYELTSISRPVTREDFFLFDSLIAMDRENMQDLRKLAPDDTCKTKCSLFLSNAPELGITEVPDPYYGGEAGFQEVIDLVEIAADALLAKLRP
ncbi:MAG: low molecular weight phosphotyrosine protein phosphatase [Kiritimatiellae bacterium]|jgi:protein-tyrosine phosphatase|nr:low molecular weight phosphotyrosine protein phosphatase [Kiritimatiellia bacterium]